MGSRKSFHFGRDQCYAKDYQTKRVRNTTKDQSNGRIEDKTSRKT